MREDDRREGPRAASEPGVSRAGANAVGAGADRPSPYASFIRAENEDDDGYDPYSDRPARAEPLFERDPWD